MKRFFTVIGLFTILFTLASCQKEQTTVLRATISHYQGDGKVYINNKIAYWHESDQIWINGTSSTGLTTLTNNTQFEIVMPDGFTPTPNADLCAVYPASFVTGTLSSTTSEGENPVTTYSIGITLPATQNYEVDNAGNQIVKAPMVAQTTFNQYGGADVTFHNVCSLLKVMVHPNVFVHTITVSQAEQAEGATTPLPSLNGDGTITFDQSTPTLQMTNSNNPETKTIVLNVNESRADGIYYIVIPPYTDPTKLIVTVFDDPQTIIERKQAENHTLPGNKIAEVNCIDYLRGIFSVSATDKVSFARGNLIGDGSADNPYNFTNEQYDAGDQYPQTNINALSAAMGSNWFILSGAQWNYLLNERDNAENLKVRATIPNGGLRGIILLPDNWSQLNCPVTVVDHNNFQGVEIENWDVVETYGAVFIPAEGMNNNYFWSTTNGTAVDFGNGEGNGGNGDICSHTGNAYIRHAHYVVQGSSNTTGN